MAHSLKWFMNKRLVIKDPTITSLAKNYLQKARNNLITVELLNKTKNFKEVLALPDDYDSDEWVVISAYYAMYMAALSLLAKLRYKSSNHSGTIVALEEFFVKKKLLDKEHLIILEKIKLQKDEIEQIEKVRDRREIAQYSVTKEITKNLAEETRQDAHKFINKIEEIFNILE